MPERRASSWVGDQRLRSLKWFAKWWHPILPRLAGRETMVAVKYALAGKRVYVPGHRGMVGGALVRRLAAENCTILTVDKAIVDLRDQAAVNTWFAAYQPQAVLLAAAKVGGIHANNTYRAEFIYDNLAIAMNIVHAAYKHGVEKLMFLGSSCIYPRLAS